MICPHKNIVHCPLYVAAHDADLCLYGCHDGHAEEGCAVKRGAMEYRSAAMRLAAVAPRLVAELSFAADIAAAREQRARNMRMSGIH